MPEYIERNEVLAQIEAKKKSIEASVNCNYRAALSDIYKTVLNIPTVNIADAMVQVRTNFERIKNMSVDELADIMYDANDRVCFENCKQGTGNKYKCPFGDIKPEDCKACIKKWLEKDVDI